MKTEHVLITVIMLFSGLQAWAQTPIGDSNFTWKLEGGILTISGTGAMPDFGYKEAPWYAGRSSITSIVVEEGVTSIGSRAFMECSEAVSVEIPEGVTTIGEAAFEYCSVLTSVSLPSTVQSFGMYVFNGCALEEIEIPDGVTAIPDASFQYCSKLATVTLPGSITSIGKYVFSGCYGLSAIEIPDRVERIGELAFQNCTTLVAINIPAGVTSITHPAFNNCSNLTINVDADNSNYSSEGGALLNKEKTELLTYQGNQALVIPGSVTRIGYRACWGNSKLASVTIPYGVMTIGNDAFRYCEALTSVTVLNPKPSNIALGNTFVFSDIADAPGLTVPTSAVSDYESADIWKDFTVVGGGLLVTATCNNNGYGSVSGSDNALYQNGNAVSFTASAGEGYQFENWTKGGVEVSTEATYAFTATEDTELVANFGEANFSTGSMSVGGMTIDLGGSDSGTGWTWHAATSTLALTSSYEGEPIRIDCELSDTINLLYDGNVSISSGTVNPIYCEGSLTIGGSNGAFVLAYTGEDYKNSAIRMMRRLTISSGDVRAECSASSSSGNETPAAIFVQGFYITGNSDVTVTATGNNTYGLLATGNSEISTTGTVTVNATGKGYPLSVFNGYYSLVISDGILNLSNNDNPDNMIYTYLECLAMTGGVVKYNNGIPPVLTGISPASGTCNMEAVLSGNYLAGTKNVYVNRKNSHSFDASENQVTFTTPSGAAGLASLFVETTGGMAPLTGGFTYTNASYRVTILSAGIIIGVTCGFLDTEAGTITKPDDPILTGYVFTGWYKDKNGSTEWDFENDIVDKDMNIYARFEYTRPVVTPANSAVNVAIDATVSADYCRSIFIWDLEELNRITIVPDPGNVSASYEGSMITIAHNEFEYGTEYTVTIPAGIVLGGYSEEDVVWSFTTSPPVGIEEVNSETGLLIYPSLATDYIYVKGLKQPLAVSICSLDGRVVLQQRVQGEEGISVSNLPAGNYLVNANGATFKIVKK